MQQSLSGVLQSYFFGAGMLLLKIILSTCFSYFNNNGKDGLHLAYSNDGYHWTALNHDSAILKPMVANDKLMRDPCIIKGADGLFHMGVDSKLE